MMNTHSMRPIRFHGNELSITRQIATDFNAFTHARPGEVDSE